MTTTKIRKAVLFDFDGTLGRSLFHWVEAYRESLQGHGVEVDHQTTLDACFNRSIVDIASRFNIKQPEQLRADIWDNVKQRMNVVEAYPQVDSALRQLHTRDFQLAIVSNSRKGHIAPVLDRWNLRRVFNAVVTIDDVENGKPHPEPIHKALELLSVGGEHAWMVGDAVVDIHAGKAAGIRTIAFSPAENHPFMPHEVICAAEPTFVARSFDEVARIIETN
jgi:pyrophosphatase PpaX